LRIAWFANIDFQEGNAANSRIRALANGLKKKGDQVFLFFLSSTVFNSNGINKKSKGFFDGLYFNYLSGTSHRSKFLLVRIFNYLIAIINSSVLLIRKRKHFDIIFIYSPRFLFFGHIYILAKLLGIPLIIEKTELEQKVTTKRILPKLISYTDRIDAYLYKYICTHLFVISDKLKDHYSNFFPATKISKIPIVVDFKRFQQIEDTSSKYSIGYLGSFSAKDGVPGIIQGFKAANQQIPKLKLNLIGFNPYKKETNQLLKLNQLNGEVSKSGQITYEQVPQWLAKCDLLIMNRTNDAYSHYGFPTKLGEYLATGIPTICSRVGDVDHYLEHKINTYFIEPGNTEQLTEAILKRYENYEQFNEIGQKGRLVAQTEFDFQKYIPILQSVFREASRAKK